MNSISMNLLSSTLLLPAIAIIILSTGEHPVKYAAAFAPPTQFSGPTSNRAREQIIYHEFSSLQLKAQNNGDDDYTIDENDIDNDGDDDEEDEKDGLDSLAGKKLGINIGSELPSLTPEELAEIRTAAQSTLDAAIDSRLADIEDLRSQLQEDLAQSRTRMETANKLNVQLESQNLMEKIDRISSEFLNKNEDFREATKKVANADKFAGSMGRGVEWGSWGNIGDGEVVISGSGSNASAVRLLGSVDAAKRRGEISADIDVENELDLPIAPAENRVLVVVDDKKDKGATPIINQLTTLLNKDFDSNIIIDTYSPYSNIPIGGNNAQTVILFASSLNDRSSLENLLGRILKRTAPVAGGAVGMPPSHVVIISSLGTDRTNKMPYSMQNLFGGKLDKLREIEQGIAAISQSRMVGKQAPLDYTIVKFGDVASSDDNVKDNGEGNNVAIQPGDVLDGDIGPNAAASVLMQAMAYQPYARNSTLCTTGSLPLDADMDMAMWNDKFLCLSGPELLRIEAGSGAADTDDGVLDSKFEQLRQYVKQWSGTYEGDRKGTGLTTPVLVRKSRFSPSEFDGVVDRSGVKILFQTTNTGDRYKTSSEEKKDEKERNGGSAKKLSSSSVKKPFISNARKEGGVEVLVEKTTGGDIRVRARRCNMDGKTVVKEMSEEVIVRSLKKAVETWLGARAI